MKKQKEEALKRLSMLEELYGLNPNVKKHFDEGKLYYSYTTGGGFLGSIDTIGYDRRYEQAVTDFEEKNAAMVYHAIEGNNMLAMLFVGEETEWDNEVPKREGVSAWVYDFDKKEGKRGYIKLDTLQGALYIKGDKVYESLDFSEKNVIEDESVRAEIIERLNILVKQGIITDLDVIDMYSYNREICISKLMIMGGEPFGIVMGLSECPEYEKLVEQIRKQVEMVPYFCMHTCVGDVSKMAILVISPEPDLWKTEKVLLSMKNPQAIVIDVNAMTAGLEDIEYAMVNGGPVFLV